MFAKLLNITHNTLTESIRQPVYLVLTLVGCLLLTLSPAAANYTLDDDNRLLINMGLSTMFLTSALIAAFVATSVLSDEIKKKTALTVISKPVPRPLFVLGKFLGVAAALGMAFWTMSMVYLLTIRHGVMQTARDTFDQPVITFGVLAFLTALLVATVGNYFYRWVFTATFTRLMCLFSTGAYLLVLVIDKHWQLQSIATEFTNPDIALGQLLMALVLVFQGILIITAAVIAASTRVGQVMTLGVAVGLFLLGATSQSLYLLGGDRWLLGRLIYHVVPNLQFLWQADALSQGHAVTGGHMLLVSAYALLFVIALLSLAVALFQTREVG